MKKITTENTFFATNRANFVYMYFSVIFYDIIYKRQLTKYFLHIFSLILFNIYEEEKSKQNIFSFNTMIRTPSVYEEGYVCNIYKDPSAGIL